MPQSTDIVINGAGYMVEPGSYKRLQDGMAEGRTERISITDFFGGQHRALQLERDKFADSLSIGPVMGGQGVQPWGTPSALTNSAIGANPKPDKGVFMPHAIVRDRTYIAIGAVLYQGPAVTFGGTFAWSVFKTYPNPIVDICIYNSVGLLVTFGAAADIEYISTATGGTVVLSAGERGYCIAAYAGYAAWSDARASSRPSHIRLVHGTGFDTRAIDHDPIAMDTFGGELIVITKQALYSFKGRVKNVLVPNAAYTVGGTQPQQISGYEWNGEFEPYFQQGIYAEVDDFRFILGYGGRTLAWIAGGVHELVPSGDRAGWRTTGLQGRKCYGGTVAAGWVIVSIESYAGLNELWAYDGNGWWRLDARAGGVAEWCHPIPLGGTSPSGTFDLGVHHHGTATVTYYRLVEAMRTDGVTLNTAYRDIAEFVTPMIDANERDKPKAWRKIGAVFASPKLFGLQSSGDTVVTYLDYSIDGGATWVSVANAAPAGNNLANMNYALESALAGVVSTFIMLRVRWLSVSTWAPILVGVWAEYEVLHNPARRRRWEFKVHARDQEIDRDGVTLSRTGRQLISELWAAWQNDSAETFRDLDYDADPTQRTVRIVGISEAVPQPADSAEWGDSIIALKLVEV